MTELSETRKEHMKFQVCDNRKDGRADIVRVRLSDSRAASNLHAADARYHNDYRKTFMS